MPIASECKKRRKSERCSSHGETDIKRQKKIQVDLGRQVKLTNDTYTGADGKGGLTVKTQKKQKEVEILIRSLT